MTPRIGLGILLASGCAAVAACTTSPTSANTLPVTVDLASGNRVALVPQGVTLQFDSVVSDSRCPVGAFCILAGQVVLSFSLTGPNAPAAGRLLLSSDRPDSTLGVVLSAEEVTPYPRLHLPPPEPRSFRVKLRIAAK